MAKKRHSGGSGTKMQARTKTAAAAAPSATATATATATWRVAALGAFAALVIGVLVGFAGRNTVTSTDIVLQRILEDVDRDDSLTNVVMELPLVETDPMKWAEHVSTATFGRFINQSAEHISLVSFFDPRSESFLVTRKDLDSAAKELHEDSELSDKVSIGVVNAAVDSFLQAHYSPEMTLSWQENEANPDENGLAGFRFGKSNYFPLITKAFQNGSVISEYTGSIFPGEILGYLRRLQAAHAFTLGSAAEVDAFLAKERFPLAVGCFPTDEDRECQAEVLAFDRFVAKERGLMFYAKATDKTACSRIASDLETCGVRVQSSADVGATLNLRTTDAKPSYLDALYDFVIKHRDPLLLELTPDNSWMVMRNFDHIAVLLLDPKQKEAGGRALSLVEQVARRPEASGPERGLKYTHANGRNFAPQFGVAMERLPCFILYNVAAGNFAVFEEDIKHKNSLDVETKAKVASSIESLTAWVAKKTPKVQLANSDPATAKTAHEANASTSKGASPSKAAQNATGSGTSETLGTSSASPETKPSPAIVENTRSTRQTWRELREIKPELVRSHIDMGQAILNVRGLYEEFLVMEESYRSFPPARQRADENKVLRLCLDKVFSYLAGRSHLKPIMDAVPDTPDDLKTLSSDAVARETLWVKIQRADAYIKHLMSVAKTLTPLASKDLRELFADDYSFLYNQRLSLLRERNDAMQQRFLKEKGRLPVIEDQQVLSIERRSALELSVEDFVNEYAKKRKPVIITDLDLFRTPWTKAYVAEKCGKHRPVFKEKSPTTQNWGGLVDVKERVSLGEFLETHTGNSTRKEWYLHDWGLPRHCPDILGPPPFEDFRFPKYFAGDYFQRMPFVGYQHSWPSLFVGANGTESRMHIDSGGTNFWMYLIEGAKEWRFFDRFDTVELYGKPGSAHFYVDVFRPDFQKMPLAVNAPMYQGTQHPGELIFIPGGCPHGVRNHDDIVGISMNYLDVSNEWLYLWMKLADHDFRDYELYANPAFPRGLRRDQKDLTFGEFKSQHWYAQSANSFDIK